MRFWFARVVMLGMAAICLTRWAQPPTVAAQQVKSQWDAIYSEPQATRGQALYVENCVICHASTLAGTDAAPALAGAGFIGKWNNKPLDELFEFMQTAMPVQSPGGLSRQQNADILAYMLRSGRFPSGQTELTPDRNLLRQIYLLASKPGSGTPPPAASPGEAGTQTGGSCRRAGPGGGQRRRAILHGRAGGAGTTALQPELRLLSFRRSQDSERPQIGNDGRVQHIWRNVSRTANGARSPQEAVPERVLLLHAIGADAAVRHATPSVNRARRISWRTSSRPTDFRPGRTS